MSPGGRKEVKKKNNIKTECFLLSQVFVIEIEMEGKAELVVNVT